MENTKTFTKNGLSFLILSIVGLIFSTLLIVFASFVTSGIVFFLFFFISIIFIITCILILAGLKDIKPNEALVLTLFGDFYGIIKEPGFYFVNPFAQAVYPKNKEDYKLYGGESMNNNWSVNISPRKISLKAMTLNSEKQKVNDANGNPIEIGVVVIWKVINPIKAVFNVENYKEFISIQSDSAIRSMARTYTYESEDNEKSLTGSTTEISDKLQELIQEVVLEGGIEIIDAKISHLAYSPEIASAMLQRQQADAIIAARQKIVDGAVGMVEQALIQLSEKEVVELDDERKAQMVTNLLVVLCANKEAQPIVNSGSIY
ncbi:MAG: SPFH domain-containing protein [Lactovum sp.]